MASTDTVAVLILAAVLAVFPILIAVVWGLVGRVGNLEARLRRVEARPVVHLPTPAAEAKVAYLESIGFSEQDARELSHVEALAESRPRYAYAKPDGEDEATWLRADIAEVTRMLCSLHGSRVAERIGLEARLVEHRKKLAALEVDDGAAPARVVERAYVPGVGMVRVIEDEPAVGDDPPTEPTHSRPSQMAAFGRKA